MCLCLCVHALPLLPHRSNLKRTVNTEGDGATPVGLKEEAEWWWGGGGNR